MRRPEWCGAGGCCCVTRAGVRRIACLPAWLAPTAGAPPAPPSAWPADELPRGCKPLLVFLNTKSGPQVGAALRRRFLRALHPLQVVELPRQQPGPALRLFSGVASHLRILVVGGDGSGARAVLGPAVPAPLPARPRAPSCARSPRARNRSGLGAVVSGRAQGGGGGTGGRALEAAARGRAAVGHRCAALAARALRCTVLRRAAPCQQPYSRPTARPLAVPSPCPGNDLARCLGWGGGNGKWAQEGIGTMLAEVQHAAPLHIDRWDVALAPPPRLDEPPATPRGAGGWGQGVGGPGPARLPCREGSPCPPSPSPCCSLRPLPFRQAGQHAAARRLLRAGLAGQRRPAARRRRRRRRRCRRRWRACACPQADEQLPWSRGGCKGGQ